jgi:hypothetical protein
LPCFTKIWSLRAKESLKKRSEIDNPSGFH